LNEGIKNKELLLAYMSSAFLLTDKEIEELISLFAERKIKRRGFILHQDDVCRHFTFVVSGCLKMYAIDPAGKEYNLEFAAENEWVSDLSSFYSEKPSGVYIEAIEPSVILQITRQDLIYLYVNYTKFNSTFRIIIERKYIQLQNRVLQNISATAEERYRYFLDQFPLLASRLPNIPRPRKDSTTYFSTRSANNDMLNCKQGLHDFQRAYFHVKSADWSENKPFPLTTPVTAEELAKQPMYYVLDLDKTMPEEVAPYMPSQKEISACKWLPDDDLDFYTQEFKRTGFQGGLNWYRCTTGGLNKSDLELFSGHTIDVPSCFITGIADWATFRPPGALEQMQRQACTKMESFHIIEGAGHWIQQEQPEKVTGLIVDFLQHV